MNVKKIEINNLSKRMKDYEKVSKGFLLPKEPVIVRVSGSGFNKFTKQEFVVGKFDRNIINSFHYATIKIAEEIPQIKIAYHHNDEVTFFLQDYNTIDATQYYNGDIQKICSAFTTKFTKYFNKILKQFIQIDFTEAEFDVKVYNVPKEEVVNNFIWRQRIFERNSLNNYCLNFFFENRLKSKNSLERKEMLLNLNKNWDELPNELKFGSLFYKINVDVTIKTESKTEQSITIKQKWYIDNNIGRIEENKTIIDKQALYF